MEIRQFLYNEDNFSYMLFSLDEALVIDGGAVKEIVEFCEKETLRVRYILNTHGHWDHVPGNKRLAKKTGGRIVSFEDLQKMKQIYIGSDTIEILFTPGHTLDSVCFYAPPILVTGDMLFNGTVGNCPADRLDMLGESLTKIMQYPADTQIYAGHDYYVDSVATIKTVDPQNPYLDEYIRQYNEKEVYSYLGMEIKVNPYLRYDSTYYKEILAERHLPDKTRLDRFKSIYQHIG